MGLLPSHGAASLPGSWPCPVSVPPQAAETKMTEARERVSTKRGRGGARCVSPAPQGSRRCLSPRPARRLRRCCYGSAGGGSQPERGRIYLSLLLAPADQRGGGGGRPEGQWGSGGGRRERPRAEERGRAVAGAVTAGRARPSRVSVRAARARHLCSLHKCSHSLTAPLLTAINDNVCDPSKHRCSKHK